MKLQFFLNKEKILRYQVKVSRLSKKVIGSFNPPFPITDVLLKYDNGPKIFLLPLKLPCLEWLTTSGWDSNQTFGSVQKSDINISFAGIQQLSQQVTRYLMSLP